MHSKVEIISFCSCLNNQKEHASVSIWQEGLSCQETSSASHNFMRWYKTLYNNFHCCIVTTMTNDTNTYTYACRTQRHNEDKRHSLLEKYTSHFIERFVCERELETEQNCNILTPTLIAISVSFLFSWAAQLGVWRPSLSGICSSIQHLLSNSSDP